jgi:hypothetical protein
MTGKCPKCGGVLQTAIVESIILTEGVQGKWHGASYVCPLCRTILGIGIDPICLKTDTVEELKKVLGK